MYDTLFVINCRICGSQNKVECNAKDYAAWKNDTLIQDALPYLDRDDRELLQTQICGECWEEYMYE